MMSRVRGSGNAHRYSEAGLFVFTCVSSKARYEVSEVTLLAFLEMWLSKRGVGSRRFFMFS